MFLLHNKIYVEFIDKLDTTVPNYAIISPTFVDVMFPPEEVNPPLFMVGSLAETDKYVDLLADICQHSEDKHVLFVEKQTYMDLYYTYVRHLCDTHNVSHVIDFLLFTKKLHLEYSLGMVESFPTPVFVESVVPFLTTDPSKMALEMMLFMYKINAFSEEEKILAQAKIASMLQIWTYARFRATREHLRSHVFASPKHFKLFFKQNFDEKQLSPIQYATKVKGMLNKHSFFKDEEHVVTKEDVDLYCSFLKELYSEIYTNQEFELLWKRDYSEWDIINRLYQGTATLDDVVEYFCQQPSRLFFENPRKFNMWPLICYNEYTSQ